MNFGQMTTAPVQPTQMSTTAFSVPATNVVVPQQAQVITGFGGKPAPAPAPQPEI
jgi:O-glycosyl hydrolase